MPTHSTSRSPKSDGRRARCIRTIRGGSTSIGASHCRGECAVGYGGGNGERGSCPCIRFLGGAPRRGACQGPCATGQGLPGAILTFVPPRGAPRPLRRENEHRV